MVHVGFVFNLHSHDRNCSCVCPGVLSRVKRERETLVRKAECDFRAPADFTGDNNRAALSLHYFLADG